MLIHTFTDVTVDSHAAIKILSTSFPILQNTILP